MISVVHGARSDAAISTAAALATWPSISSGKDDGYAVGDIGECPERWWDVTGTDMTGQEMLTWGPSMRWVLRLIETGMPSGVSGVDVMEISRPDGASNRADLGLTLSEAKQLLACVQQAIVAAQAGDLAARRPECSSCSGRCHVNGRRCQICSRHHSAR